jgi:hypothetical protein
MRYGNDYGSDHWWGRAVHGDAGNGWMRAGVGRGFGGGGGGAGGYPRRDISVVRGGYGAERGYAGDFGGGGQGRAGWTGTPGTDRGRMDRDEPRHGGHRFFGRWANDDEAGTWESDRHGVGRYAADPRMAERGGTGRGRGYSRDYDAGMRGGWTGGRGAAGGGAFGWGRGDRGRYDRGW